MNEKNLEEGLFNNSTIENIIYKENSKEIIIFYKDSNKNNMTVTVVDIKEKADDSQIKKLKELNKGDNNSIVGKPLIDWIIRNEQIYGMDIGWQEDNVLSKFYGAEIKKILFETDQNGNNKKIKLEFKNEINGKKSFDILLDKDIDIDDIRKVFDDKKIEGMLLFNFVQQYKEKLIWIQTIIKQNKVKLEDLRELNYQNIKDDGNFICDIKYDEANKKIIAYYNNKNNNDKYIGGFKLSLREKLTDAQKANLIKLNNSDNKEEHISGKKIFYWITKNLETYGIDIKLPEMKYEGLDGFENANVIEVSVDNKESMITVHFKSAIKGRSFVEIPYDNDNVLNRDINNINSELKLLEPSFLYFFYRYKDTFKLTPIENKLIENKEQLTAFPNATIQKIKYDTNNNQLAVYYNDNKIIKRLSFVFFKTAYRKRTNRT